jgi:RHS repeat-associated protein
LLEQVVARDDQQTVVRQILPSEDEVDIGAGTVTNPQTNTNLTFDGCGNQTSLNGGGTFVVDYLNEYTTFNGAPITNDNDGDVLTYNGWVYVYDAQNRLTSATSSGVTASFYYDGLNRQIARSINGAITFSVWDGDWAILEEYGPSNVVAQKYLQGYHGLVKTLVGTGTYYYQDELGSTSHIANASGALLEYYRYDLYGKPRYFNSSGTEITSSAYNIVDLGNGGARWMTQLALYDDRNRFMSPALGRFIQPDPIGFKGDASNLYRYCGNDWANRTDPTGLAQEPWVPNTYVDPAKLLQQAQKQLARLVAQYNARLWNYGASVLGPLKNQINQLQQSTQSLSSEQMGATQAQKGSALPHNSQTHAPATVKREVGDKDKGFYPPFVGAPDGTTTKVYSRPWIQVKYQFAGEAATPGTVVTEKVSIVDKQGVYEPYEFKPFQPQRISPARTMGDRFSFPFVSPTGYATFSQTLSLSSGVTTTWNTTLHANGAYEIDPSNTTLHY